MKNTQAQESDVFIIHSTQVLQPSVGNPCIDFCHVNKRFHAYIAEDALRQIYDSSLQKYMKEKYENAGALLGSAYQIPDEKIVFVVIDYAITEKCISDEGSTAVPASAWFDIHRLIDRDPQYQGKSAIVGWFHSHPGFHVFMSVTDRSTQQKHFIQDWQVAVVIDPLEPDIGCYYGSNSQVCPLYVLPRPTDKSLVLAKLRLAKIAERPSSNLHPADSGGGVEKRI